jgi:uncharacterized membrane protein
MVGGEKACLGLWLLLLPALASALALQSFEAEFDVSDNAVVVTYSMVADENGLLALKLPAKTSGLSAFVEGKKSFFEFKAADKEVVLPVSEGQEVVVSFVSSSSVEAGDGQNYFVYSFEPGIALAAMPAKLVLPEGALLASPAEEGSVLPSPENITSDGRILEINWLFEGGETIFVSFIPPAEANGLTDWLVLLLLVLGLAAVAALWFSRKKLERVSAEKEEKVKDKPKAGQEKPGAKEEKEPELRGLTPEEKEVVLALHNNPEKQLTQSRLKDLTGLSKVKLSRIIARLEKREVVGKRPYGNTNLVFLPKKD